MTRSFFAGKQKGLSNYTKKLSGVSLTALAMLGISRQATAEEVAIEAAPDGYKPVEDIRDFESVTSQADGTVDVVLKTGETVTFKASEIAIVGGQVFVAESAVVAAGFAIAGTGFALSTSAIVAGAAVLAGGAVAISSSGDSGGDNDGANVNTNVGPVFTSQSNFSVSENQNSAFSATASDSNGDTISYSLSGTDAGLFSINSSTGAVMFNDAPDFESAGDANSDNTYELTVTASDGSASVSQTVNVSVTNANEAPVVTVVTAATVDENQIAAFTATATDVDGDDLSFTLSGDDAALFAIDAETGVVTFLEAPDFETPGDADGDNVHFLR